MKLEWSYFVGPGYISEVVMEEDLVDFLEENYSRMKSQKDVLVCAHDVTSAQTRFLLTFLCRNRIFRFWVKMHLQLQKCSGKVIWFDM